MKNKTKTNTSIKLKYNLGDVVFLKTDVSQKERMVTSITLTPNGLYYILSCGDDESNHYDIEISTKKDILKTLNTYDD